MRALEVLPTFDKPLEGGDDDDDGESDDAVVCAVVILAKARGYHRGLVKAGATRRRMELRRRTHIAARHGKFWGENEEDRGDDDICNAKLRY